jgi:hypothetical protein
MTFISDGEARVRSVRLTNLVKIAPQVCEGEIDGGTGGVMNPRSGARPEDRIDHLRFSNSLKHRFPSEG